MNCMIVKAVSKRKKSEIEAIGCFAATASVVNDQDSSPSAIPYSSPSRTTDRRGAGNTFGKANEKTTAWMIIEASPNGMIGSAR